MTTTKLWSERVTAWRASGETASAFASGRGYSASTLRWWSSRLGRAKEGVPRVAEVRLARVVRVGSRATAAEAIVIELGGARVAVPVGADEQTLTTVLNALAARGGTR